MDVIKNTKVIYQINMKTYILLFLILFVLELIGFLNIFEMDHLQQEINLIIKTQTAFFEKQIQFDEAIKMVGR